MSIQVTKFTKEASIFLEKVVSYKNILPVGCYKSCNFTYNWKGYTVLNRVMKIVHIYVHVYLYIMPCFAVSFHIQDIICSFELHGEVGIVLSFFSCKEQT